MEDKEYKYLLAIDGYTLQGGSGYSQQAFKLDKNNTLIPLKEAPFVDVVNLDNFVGGGESVEYDLLRFPADYEVCVVRTEKNETSYKAVVIMDKDLDYEQPELVYFEAVMNSLLNFTTKDKVEFVGSFELCGSKDLSEINDHLADNDFAKRFLATEEDRAEVYEWFKKEKNSEKVASLAGDAEQQQDYELKG